MLRMSSRVAALTLAAFPATASADMSGIFAVSIFPVDLAAIKTSCIANETSFGIAHSIPIDFAPVLSEGGPAIAPGFRLVMQSFSQPYQISQSGVGSGNAGSSGTPFTYAQICQLTPVQTTSVAEGTQVSGSFTCSETEQVNPDPANGRNIVKTGVTPPTAGQFSQLFTAQGGGLFSSTLWMTSGTCKAKYIATGRPG